MKKVTFFSLLFTTVFLASCIKGTKPCTDKSPASEESAILAFASANGINAVKHSSGIYYEIIDAGTGVTPDISSLIKVTYVGTYLNGQIFDQLSTPPSQGWPLSGLIAGWQIGLPLISNGGHIKLIIPSAYAYGCNGVSGVPANSVLYFDINLVDVQ